MGLAARTPRSVAFAAADALALGFPGLGPAKISQSAGVPNGRCWDLIQTVTFKDVCRHPLVPSNDNGKVGNGFVKGNNLPFFTSFLSFGAIVAGCYRWRGSSVMNTSGNFRYSLNVDADVWAQLAHSFKRSSAAVTG